MPQGAAGPCAARRAAHEANHSNRAIRNSKSAVAANTAAANAFPDRGGGGYWGRSLPQVFRSVSVIVSPCWLQLPAACRGQQTPGPYSKGLRKPISSTMKVSASSSVAKGLPLSSRQQKTRREEKDNCASAGSTERRGRSRVASLRKPRAPAMKVASFETASSGFSGYARR
jgi:hypothetical protein